MTTLLGDLDIEEAAKMAAGNWERFSCFAWFRKNDITRPNDWAVIYTHNRDSGLLDQSNAGVIATAIEPFSNGNDPDVVFESHHHWACGHIDGFSIRVFRRGRITKAFRTYHKLSERLAEYPILDEADYSNREYEATYENIGEAAWKLKQEFNLPEHWQSDVYSWLADNRDHAIDNVDDQGGWPGDDDLAAAFAALGYQRAA